MSTLMPCRCQAWQNKFMGCFSSTWAFPWIWTHQPSHNTLYTMSQTQFKHCLVVDLCKNGHLGSCMINNFWVHGDSKQWLGLAGWFITWAMTDRTHPLQDSGLGLLPAPSFLNGLFLPPEASAASLPAHCPTRLHQLPSSCDHFLSSLSGIITTFSYGQLNCLAYYLMIFPFISLEWPPIVWNRKALMRFYSEL